MASENEIFTDISQNIASILGAQNYFCNIYYQENQNLNPNTVNDYN